MACAGFPAALPPPPRRLLMAPIAARPRSNKAQDFLYSFSISECPRTSSFSRDGPTAPVAACTLERVHLVEGLDESFRTPPRLQPLEGILEHGSVKRRASLGDRPAFFLVLYLLLCIAVYVCLILLQWYSILLQCHTMLRAPRLARACAGR